MTTDERREVINILTECYEFLCGSRSEKAEQDMLTSISLYIDRLKEKDKYHECCGMKKNTYDIRSITVKVNKKKE